MLSSSICILTGLYMALFSGC